MASNVETSITACLVSMAVFDVLKIDVVQPTRSGRTRSLTPVHHYVPCDHAQDSEAIAFSHWTVAFTHGRVDFTATNIHSGRTELSSL